MISERASGIILRVRPLTDSSLIIHWLCPEAGRIATVAKGARTAKSLFAGKLDLAVEAEFAFVRSTRSDLHTLREVGVVARYAGLREDYARLNQWAYAVALVEALTETGTPLPEVYPQVAGFLGHLSGHAPQPRSVLALELRLLSVLGLEPDPVSVGGGPAVTELLRNLVEMDWNGLPELRPSAASVRSIKGAIERAIVSHCGRLPKGRAEALGGG